MKKFFIIVIIVVFTISCDTGRVNNNPNIPNYTVNLQLNLNFYPLLQLAGNHIVNFDVGSGARGIVIFNTGNNVYVAYDLACPNQPFNICTSAMTVSGNNATCDCDSTVYNLYTGQCPGQPYPMKQYHVEVSGGYLFVNN
jgi:nitrite reductase/ring-hydroxylating ferredoxin subunit